MRYRDFKLNEEVIGVANMSSQPGYIDAVNELLKNNSSFAMGKGGQYMFQPDPGQQVNSMEGGITGKGRSFRTQKSVLTTSVTLYRTSMTTKPLRFVNQTIHV